MFTGTKMKSALALCLFACLVATSCARRDVNKNRYARRRNNACKIMCTQFVRHMEQRVQEIEIRTGEQATNSSVLKQFGEEFCKLRAPGSRLCQGLMLSHRDIFDGIENYVKADAICKKIPVCRRGRKEKKRGSDKPLNWSPKKRCDICRATIQIVDSSLQIINFTAAGVDKMVMMSCQFMSSWGSVRKECENIVKQIERIERLLMKDLAPGDVCAVLGYCNFTASVEQEKEKQSECGIADKMATFSPFRTAFGFMKTFVPKVFSNQLNDTLGSIIKRTALVSTVTKCMDKMDRVSSEGKIRKARSVEEGSRCQVCSVLSKGSLKTLEMNEDVRGLSSNLKKLCDKVSSDYAKHRCKIMSAIVGKPESMIADVVSPEVCNRVPCSLVVRGGMIKSNDKACDVCKLVAKLVGQETNYIEKLIEAVAGEVDMICKDFGGEEEAAVCKKVTTALKKLTEAIAKAFSVVNICREIGLCPNSPGMKLLQRKQ